MWLSTKANGGLLWAVDTSESSVNFYQIAWCNIPEDNHGYQLTLSLYDRVKARSAPTFQSLVAIVLHFAMRHQL